MSLASKILIGVLAGAAFGLFFGEATAPLGLVGAGYVGLLQLTVLPFVVVSLISNIGRSNIEVARRAAGRAAVILLALRGIAIVIAVAMPLSLPAWEGGTFYSASLVEPGPGFDFLGAPVGASSRPSCSRTDCGSRYPRCSRYDARGASPSSSTHGSG